MRVLEIQGITGQVQIGFIAGEHEGLGKAKGMSRLCEDRLTCAGGISHPIDVREEATVNGILRSFPEIRTFFDESDRALGIGQALALGNVLTLAEIQNEKEPGADEWQGLK